MTYDRFKYLREKWRQDTELESSLNKILEHPAYQEIIAAGPTVIPWIFEELKGPLDHWFWALSVLTGKDVATGARNMEEAKWMWLNWYDDQKVFPKVVHL